MTPALTRSVGVQFLERFFDGIPGDIELRAIKNGSSRQYKQQVFTRNRSRLDQFITTGLTRRANLYFGCATRKGKIGDAAHCESISALWSDIDFKDTPEPEALKRLGAFPFPPSIKVRSGGGIHSYWLMKEPVSAQEEQLRTILRGIAHTLNCDMACAEIARVLRIPGTLNFKPEYGKPREVAIEQADWGRRYNLNDFEMFATVSGNGNGHSHAGEFLGIPIPSGVNLHAVLATKLNFEVRHVGDASWFDYHGLRGFHGKPQACLIQGSPHKEQLRNPRQSSFVERAGKFAHHCFDSDCQSVGRDAETEGKTRKAVRALGLEAVLLFESQAKAGFDLVRLGDLLREPNETIEWCVKDMLPASGLSLWPAKPKVGKSTLLRHLALCVARGDRFLGRAVQQGTVVYLALEEKRSQVRQHFRAMGATGDEDIYIHAAHAPASALAALCKLVNEKKPFLIIIDPLQKMMRAKDTNDYAEITLALEPFLILARESGAHIAVAHHAGKVERSDATDGILGSTALFGGVDVAVVLKKCENYRTVTTQGRYGVDLEETVLTLDPKTQTPTMGGSRKEAEAERISQNILFVLADPKPKERPEIMREAEGKSSIKNRVFKQLLRDGLIVQTGAGKRSDPYLYFLAGNPAETPCTHISGTRNTGKTETLFPSKEEKRCFYYPESFTGVGTRKELETNPLENQQEILVPGGGNQKAQLHENAECRELETDPPATGPKPTPIPCVHCGETQPSRVAYSRHLDWCPKRPEGER